MFNKNYKINGNMFLFGGFAGSGLVWSVINGFGVWLTIVFGLMSLWPLLDFQKPELTWAVTVTTGFFLFYLGILLCHSRQMILEDRIEQCAKAKGELEDAVLKKRLSSVAKSAGTTTGQRRKK